MNLQSAMNLAGFNGDLTGNDLRVEARKAYNHWEKELEIAIANRNWNLQNQSPEVKEKFIAHMKERKRLAASFLGIS